VNGYLAEAHRPSEPQGRPRSVPDLRGHSAFDSEHMDARTREVLEDLHDLVARVRRAHPRRRRGGARLDHSRLSRRREVAAELLRHGELVTNHEVRGDGHVSRAVRPPPAHDRRRVLRRVAVQIQERTEQGALDLHVALPGTDMGLVPGGVEADAGRGLDGKQLGERADLGDAGDGLDAEEQLRLRRENQAFFVSGEEREVRRRREADARRAG